MYSRILLLLAVFILLCNRNIIAQEIFWTSEARGLRQSEVIGAKGNALYVLEEDQKEDLIRLVRYEKGQKNSQLLSELKGKSGDGSKYEFACMHDQSIQVFTTTYDKENESIRAYCTVVSLDGKIAADSVLVHSAKASSRNNAPVFGYTLSPDSSLILLYFDPPYERKSTESLSFRCYDRSLDLKWEKDILLPYTQEVVQVHSFLIDRSGNVYMMSGRNPSKSGSAFQKPQGGRYVAFYYNATTRKLKEYDISLKDKQILSVDFVVDSKDNVRIAGYYSNDFRFTAAGTFLFGIAHDGGVVERAGFMPFSKDFLMKHMKRSQAESSAGLPDYFLDHIVMLNDSALILVGEQYFTSEVLLTDPTTGRQTIEYRYNFDDLMLTRLDQSGRQIWNTKIPKSQYSTGSTGNCSYLFYHTDKLIHIFFNDEEENQEELKDNPHGSAYTWSGSRNSVTTQINVQPDGSFSRSVFLRNKEVDALLNPFHSGPCSNGTFFMQYNDGKYFKYAFVQTGF